MKNRKLIIGLGCAGVVVFICIIGALFGGGLTPSAQATATPIPSPTDTSVPPTPTPIVWILEAPEGFTHGLFTKDALTDESCLDCVLGDLVGGTRLSPAPEGCQQTTWDASYIYCHVQVLDGNLAGTVGWVNERFVKK